MKLSKHFVILCMLFSVIFGSKSALKSSLRSTMVERPVKSFMSFMSEKSKMIKSQYEQFKFKSKENLNPAQTFKYSSFEDKVWESWLMISSSEFHNLEKFPPLQIKNFPNAQIETDQFDFRINKANCVLEKKKPFEDNRLFYFNLGTCKLAYTATPSDVNMLGMIDLANDITNISKDEDYTSQELLYCLILTDRDSKEWKICGNDEEDIKTALCLTAKCNKIEEKYSFCFEYASDLPLQVVENVTKQPIVLVPLPSPNCNEKWDYKQLGEDWNCICKQGNDQSPVDLPNQSNSIISPVRPSLNYNLINPLTTPTLDGSVSETLAIKNSGKYLHIMHDDMGRLITEDGTIYQAQEIMFHTPSNHKINGKQYDLEVVIIHSGITKGDIAKQATLSFLFETAPGIYNKFFDDIDFFNLPNPYTKQNNLTNSLYIPKLLYESTEKDVDLKPFSFYTYQGSLMVPPCTENTVVYVASNPLKISNTVVNLLREALKKPDLINQKTKKVYTSESVGVSNRKIQPTNGRPIFFYESCKDEVTSKEEIQEGHYEKVIDKATQYIYVNGSKPSDIPGAFVVTQDEAMRINNY